MAKRRRKSLGFSPDRWSVFTVGAVRGKRQCSQSTYTSYGDAAKAALRCSKQSKKPCLLLSGWSSNRPKVIGACIQGRCRQAKEEDAERITKCGINKKNRRALISERVKVRTSRVVTSMGPPKSKSGVFPREKLPKLEGRSRRRR